jgi:L-ascorbate metabolism protein UlaG (beta-lactamase superfamily)
MLKAKRAVPMHYNTFELIEVDPGIFKKEAEKHGARVDVRKPGETLEL